MLNCPCKTQVHGWLANTMCRTINLLCIIIFIISKIRPESLLGLVKAKKFLQCLWKRKQGISRPQQLCTLSRPGWLLWRTRNCMGGKISSHRMAKGWWFFKLKIAEFIDILLIWVLVIYHQGYWQLGEPERGPAGEGSMNLLVGNKIL